MSKHLNIIALLLTFILPVTIVGQDIENLIKDAKNRLEAPPLKISGGINSSLQLYSITGMENRADPLMWRIRANFRMDFLGFKVPVSGIFSTKSTVFNYQLPAFAFAGMSPSYKWATLHLGDRTMTFSPYSLSGHSFRGIGVELKPGDFRFSALHGRLKRARAEDLGKLQNIESPYRRMAWGIKMGYDNGQDELAISLFNARDDAESVEIYDSIPYHPAENVVLGFNGKKQFGKSLFLAVEFAHSIFTQNQNAPARSGRLNFLQRAGGLITPLNATSYNNALKTKLGFQTNFGTMAFEYERIDPHYRSLGTLFFNNDLENFTGGLTASFFKKKVHFSGKFGIQRNNLSGNETNTTTRFIGNINANATINNRMNVSLAYSNFSNTNRLKSLSNPLQPIDSIVLVLVNKNMSLASTYQLSQKQTSVLSMVLMYQEANNIENDEINQEQQSQYWLAQLAHQYQNVGSKIGFTSALQVNYGRLPQLESLTIGPSIGVNASLLKGKLEPNSTLSLTANAMDGSWVGNILTWQNRISYLPHPDHRFSLISAFAQRSVQKSAQANAFSEWIMRLEYGWGF